MEEKEHVQPYSEDEINLLDLLLVLVKRKRLIIYFTIGVMLLTAIISLIMPPIYKAETKILPPQQTQSTMTQFINQLGAAAGIVGGAAGIKQPNDLYIGLLKSRTLLDRMIDRFDLMKVYKAERRDGARNTLLAALDAADDKKSGLLTIGVQDRDPKRAAAMANGFVEELKGLTKGLAVSEAAQRRFFFEEQLAEAREALLKAEEEMKGFQEKTGILQVDSQAKAVIDTIAQLRAQIAVKEVELRVLKTYSTKENPDLKKAEEALKGLKAELARMERKDGSGHDPLMPTGRMPAVGTEFLRKYRNFKFHEQLYEFLLQQYQAAKLDEAKDATIIQVVDKAEPPEMRFKPKRKLMVLVAGVSAFFLSVFAAFFMEYVDKSNRDPETREKMQEIKKNLLIGKYTNLINHLIKRAKR